MRVRRASRVFWVIGNSGADRSYRSYKTHRTYQIATSLRALPGPARYGLAVRLCRSRGRIGSDLADAALDLIDDLAQHPRRILNARSLLRRQRQFDLLPRPAAADDCGHRQAHVAHAVQTLLQRTHRENASRIQRDRLLHLAD